MFVITSGENPCELKLSPSNILGRLSLRKPLINSLSLPRHNNISNLPRFLLKHGLIIGPILIARLLAGHIFFNNLALLDRMVVQLPIIVKLGLILNRHIVAVVLDIQFLRALFLGSILVRL